MSDQGCCYDLDTASGGMDRKILQQNPYASCSAALEGIIWKIVTESHCLDAMAINVLACERFRFLT